MTSGLTGEVMSDAEPGIQELIQKDGVSESDALWTEKEGGGEKD